MSKTVRAFILLYEIQEGLPQREVERGGSQRELTPRRADFMAGSKLPSRTMA